MNEVLWLGGAELAGMLTYLEGKRSDRKFRLFACACVRRYWERLRYRTPREAVETAERLAEGQAQTQQIEEIRPNAETSAAGAPEFEQPLYMGAAATLAESALEAARIVQNLCRLQAIRDAVYELVPGEDELAVHAAASEAECRSQAHLLREIVGNPFRPIRVDPNWLHVGSGAAASMAQVIDEEQRFGELPYLADALMDAGCTEDALLSHLRQSEMHVRGCWALDLLLAKE